MGGTGRHARRQARRQAARQPDRESEPTQLSSQAYLLLHRGLANHHGIWWQDCSTWGRGGRGGGAPLCVGLLAGDKVVPSSALADVLADATILEHVNMVFWQTFGDFNEF